MSWTRRARGKTSSTQNSDGQTFSKTVSWMAENNTDMDRRGQEVNGVVFCLAGFKCQKIILYISFAIQLLVAYPVFHYLRTSAVRNLTSDIIQCVLSTAYNTTLRQIAISDFLLLYAQTLCSELILFIYSLTTLSVSQTIQRRMKGRYVNEKLERMCKVAVVA
jgi:hypothetical protein